MIRLKSGNFKIGSKVRTSKKKKKMLVPQPWFSMHSRPPTQLHLRRDNSNFHQQLSFFLTIFKNNFQRGQLGFLMNLQKNFLLPYLFAMFIWVFFFTIMKQLSQKWGRSTHTVLEKEKSRPFRLINSYFQTNSSVSLFGHRIVVSPFFNTLYYLYCKR